MEILKTLKETIVDNLSATEGKALDISANITAPEQLNAIMEAHAHSHLGSAYVIDRIDLLKRLTNSYQGRYRSDLVEIGKGPEYTMGNGGGNNIGGYSYR